MKPLILACITSLISGAAIADEPRPVITGVQLYLNGGHVVCDVQCNALFNERVAGTVQSGLPALLELLYSVHDRDDASFGGGVRAYELRYDVWDDLYTVESAESAMVFSSFAQMTHAVERLRHIVIVPLDRLEADGEYALRMSIAVHPLRSVERDRISDIVDESVRTNESWREQVLNLNDLISGFFSRNQSADRSAWFSTPFFTPSSLVHHESEAP